MTEELKDKVDARESFEERRRQLDEQYAEYISKRVPADDMAQEENTNDLDNT